ncbi:MAG: glutamate--tRNA ligase [Flavobacteriaceae bacterium]
MSDVRVRFAPSPTGPLHIGGVRTALYNYLFAKKLQGTFVLRIEDTDQTRYVPQAEKYIIDSLEWANIPFDEGPGKNEKYGPYRQSERKSIYQEYIKTLLQKGHAYYAFDTAEELDILRQQAQDEKEVFSYNQHNRESLNNSLNTAVNTEELIANGQYVIRFKTPKNQELELCDLIRGKLNVNTTNLDDKILFKSDGMPTYHFANIVDDHLMKITHVIRGEEWLPSMPLHQLLYDAFGWDAPEFAHLPLILKPVGKGKLSKRDGDKLGFPVFPLNYQANQDEPVTKGYKEEGYFPEAFINMLALLGWNPGTEQEIFTLNELIQEFNLERVSKSGAKFNPEKNIWFNHQWLQKMDYSRLKPYYVSDLQNNQIEPNDFMNDELTRLVKERANFPQELYPLTSYFYKDPEVYEPKAVKKQWKEATPEIMKNLIIKLEEIRTWEASIIEQEIKDYLTENELGFGKVMPPLRLLMVGSLSGPDLFQIMQYLGHATCKQRILNGLEKL